MTSIKKWFENYISKNLSQADEAKAIREIPARIDGQIKLFDKMLLSSIEANQALKKEGITGEELANKTTNNSDLQYADREHYWKSGFSHSEMSYVERIAKHEVERTDNYIDIGNKWLYNNRKDKPYFALYSTAHIDNPTVMYASKGKQAEFEHQFLIDNFMAKVDNDERIILRTDVIDKILSHYGYVVGKENVDSGNTMGRGSNKRNVVAYSRNSRNRPSEAFLDCLRNIAETQKRNEQRGVVQYSDRDTNGRELSKGQAEYFKNSTVRDENGNLLVMYHGSPKTDISSFRLDLGGAYFTANPEYAKE